MTSSQKVPPILGKGGKMRWFDLDWKKMKRVGLRVWGMGHSDPREVVFAVKMGVALFIISLLSFLKQPFQDVEKYSLWAILTVVLIFEFNIGK
ncbi:hypothetical protein TSUD_144800 [Trifolium subterraneum]|uniref:Aluminum-activated malate transporter n=1 Tax=Trifolium subterraneum TaxID=3900 RepID=A0A2Z6NNI3_TRISU|nr:hypothetical protein TSUD_144800 [Trifolium subterraneum]